MWSNRNSHSFLVGMQNGTVILEASLAVTYKGKQSYMTHQLHFLFTKMSQKYMSTEIPATLFLIVPIGSKQIILQKGNWLNKLSCIHAIQNYH